MPLASGFLGNLDHADEIPHPAPAIQQKPHRVNFACSHAEFRAATPRSGGSSMDPTREVRPMTRALRDATRFCSPHRVWSDNAHRAVIGSVHRTLPATSAKVRLNDRSLCEGFHEGAAPARDAEDFPPVDSHASSIRPHLTLFSAYAYSGSLNPLWAQGMYAYAKLTATPPPAPGVEVHRWVVPLGAPSTVSDLVGSADMTRVGTLTATRIDKRQIAWAW